MSDQTVLIRRATVADAPIIVAHRRAMFEAMGYTSCADLDAMDAKFAEWIVDKLTRGEYQGWFIANGQGAVVAGAGLWFVDWPAHPLDQSGKRAYVLNVYTCPDYRRRGLARRLMMMILDYGRARKLRMISLHASNEGRPLYESLGFQQTNEMRFKLTTMDENE
jgi:ribosomal protein S18 acetylase RimI-like enzyme